MKRLFTYALMLGAVAFLAPACNQENGPLGDDLLGAQLYVDIQGLPMGTKADGDVEYQTEQEKKVSQLDVAIYDADGNLEWNKHYDESSAVGRKIISGLSEGQKTIAVAANIAFTVPQTIAEFKAIATALNDNAVDNFVMTGTGEGIASTNPEPVVVRLERVAAKFLLDGTITTEWESDPPTSFDIETIYLANVAVNSNFDDDGSAGPEINLRSTTELTTDELYANFTVAQKSRWSSGEKFNGENTRFYGYPNSTDTRTAILIKAKYDGRDTYYPLVIDQAINNNTLYHIGNIKITTEGMENPWDEWVKVKIIFDIQVVDWDYWDIYPEYTF